MACTWAGRALLCTTGHGHSCRQLLWNQIFLWWITALELSRHLTMTGEGIAEVSGGVCNYKTLGSCPGGWWRHKQSPTATSVLEALHRAGFSTGQCGGGSSGSCSSVSWQWAEEGGEGDWEAPEPAASSSSWAVQQPAPAVQGEWVTMLPARPDVLLWMVGALSCLHPALFSAETIIVAAGVEHNGGFAFRCCWAQYDVWSPTFLHVGEKLAHEVIKLKHFLGIY